MYRDLTRGSISRSLILFALPMMAGNMLQQFYNIADTLIVGQALGKNALAAVGSAYTLMTFLTSIFIGLSMGAGALFSIYLGKNDRDSLKSAIVHAFGLIMAVTIVMNVIVYICVNPILTFLQVPDELYYAAKVDGTSDLKYLFKVMIPICRPTVVTITILKVIECWNSYVWPRLITDDQSYFLVSNGIQEIRENGFGRENIPAMMAAVVAISLPLIVLFLIFRKKIMEGVSRGGVKG